MKTFDSSSTVRTVWEGIRDMPIRTFASFVVSFILSTTVALAANVTARNCDIMIDGTIDKKSPALLETALKALRQDKNCDGRGFVRPVGPGGDVESAILMGRAIRRENRSTMGVLHMNAGDYTCASACVLVFLGGVKRIATSTFEIGLHRPYTASPSDSIDTAKAKYQKVNVLLSAYFTELNIPLRLLDVMNSVSPGELRRLNELRDHLLLQELGITGEDPVYADYEATQIAKLFGISKSDYYSRKQRASVECWGNDSAQPATAKKSWENMKNSSENSAACQMEILKGTR